MRVLGPSWAERWPLKKGRGCAAPPALSQYGNTRGKSHTLTASCELLLTPSEVPAPHGSAPDGLLGTRRAPSGVTRRAAAPGPGESPGPVPGELSPTPVFKTIAFGPSVSSVVVAETA